MVRLRSRSPVKPSGTISRAVVGVLLLALYLAGCSAVPRDYAVQEGDILFQPLPHGQLVDAIEGLSLSIDSHCGIVDRKGGDWYVLEAIGPVRETPLGVWVARQRNPPSYNNDCGTMIWPEVFAGSVNRI